MTPVSIFNDVIGPVMRGPSSSHCAAALRIGRLARDLMDGEVTEVLVEFDREGSLPTTHESQGSDLGLFGGLLGWDADDERLPNSARALEEAGIRLRIDTVDVGDPPHEVGESLVVERGQRCARVMGRQRAHAACAWMPALESSESSSAASSSMISRSSTVTTDSM